MIISLFSVMVLLVIYQVKHFIADYPLQGRYMLGKFYPFPHFILPLLAHSSVHGLFTFLIAVWYVPPGVALFLAGADMGIHFLVDMIKANPSLGGRWTALSKKEMKNILSYRLSDLAESSQLEIKEQLKSNVYFWWALGADQTAHHLTHYAIIAVLLS